VPGLAQVRGAGQEHHAAIGAEVQALEKAVAEGVVSGQVVHTFLTKDEQSIETPSRHRLHRGLAPSGKLGSGEVDSHVRWLLFCSSGRD